MQYDKVSDLADLADLDFFNIQTFLRNSFIHAHIIYQSWVPQSDVMCNTNTRDLQKVSALLYFCGKRWGREE